MKTYEISNVYDLSKTEAETFYGVSDFFPELWDCVKDCQIDDELEIREMLERMYPGDIEYLNDFKIECKEA